MDYYYLFHRGNTVAYMSDKDTVDFLVGNDYAVFDSIITLPNMVVHYYRKA